MFPTTLLTTLLLALSVAANPVLVNRSPVTLPISRRVNLSSVKNLLQHDQNRAKALKLKGAARAAGISLQEDAASVISSQVDNQAVTYVAAVGVGSPPTTYQLLVDTGSSNTWVGAGIAYVKTSTSVETADKVAVTYGSGSFSGTEFTDTVTIAPGLVITKQSIGVASTSTGFEGVDGIIGIGPVDLTLDTLSPATTSTIPTVTDNLFSQGIISAHEIGVSFEPSITGNDLNGEITWGGTDSTKFTGAITFIPLTTTSPASEFWGINQEIKLGSTTILATTAGIVDTGTTLILLSTNGFNAYQKATDSVLDETTGLLRITAAQFADLPSLSFITGGATFTLTANAQIWPRALNTDIGGIAGRIYLITNSLGTPSGEGLDFINGFAFLERFYAVFDTANKRVGFATTTFTDATTN
jgi:cathepsin E